MNVLDQNGLQLQTRQQIIDEILNGTSTIPGLYQIYGNDINVDPNTPDGNFINIIAQIAVDYQDLLQQVYNDFNPNTALGVGLDRDCAYNGVVRKAGTPSTQMVTVTVNQALTLQGLDTFPNSPFIVSDNAGNQFALLNTYAFGGAGSQNLNFQAVQIGATVVAANTLTTIVTVQLGVTSVTNGTLSGTTGTATETDYALRLRRQQSVALPSKGYLQGLIGALLAITGVTSAEVLENITNTTDANGIPGHSIWVIVAGGANADIANAIYIKRNAGCGMKGGISVPITQVDLTVFNVLFDRPTSENLYISFSVHAVTGTVDATFIKNQILALLSYQIGQSADASAITALVKQISPNASVSLMQVSPDGATWSQLLAPTGVNYQFAIAAGRIAITVI